MNEARQILMTSYAFFHDFLAFQRADPLMAEIGCTVFLVHSSHMTVRTGEHTSMNTAFTQECLKFRMLCLEHHDARSRIRIIRKTD